jgi:hypothetical protein
MGGGTPGVNPDDVGFATEIIYPERVVLTVAHSTGCDGDPAEQ